MLDNYYYSFMFFFTYCSVVLLLSSCSFTQTSKVSEIQTGTIQSSSTLFELDGIVFSGSNWRHQDLEYLQYITKNYFNSGLVNSEFSVMTESPLLITVEWSKRFVPHPYLKNTYLNTILRKRGSINKVPKMMVSLILRVQSKQILKSSQEVELRDLFGVLELNDQRVENAFTLGTRQLIKHIFRVTH